MHSLAEQLAAAVQEVRVGDVTLMLTPLTGRDLMEFPIFVRRRLVRALVEEWEAQKASEGLMVSDSERMSVMMRGLQIPLDSLFLHHEMFSHSGVIWFLHRSMRRVKPDTTIEEVAEIYSLNNMGKMGELLNMLFPPDFSKIGKKPEVQEGVDPTSAPSPPTG